MNWLAASCLSPVESTRALNSATVAFMTLTAASSREIISVWFRCTTSTTGLLTTPNACSTGHPTRPRTAPKFTAIITIIATGRVARSRFGSGIPSVSVEGDDASGVKAGFASGPGFVMTFCGLIGRLARLRQARSCAISLDGRDGATEKSPQSIYPLIAKKVCEFADEYG